MNDNSNHSNEAVLQALDVSKSFKDSSASQLSILNKVNLHILPAQSIAIVGASGSGKTTLLQILGGLAKPSSGEVLFQGRSFNRMLEKQLCQIRNQSLGFVYQFHHLLPELTALDNVAMPLHLRAMKQSVAHTQAKEWLDRVGLADRWHHRPAQLSGGERQRVAIARSLVNQPACLLADEPTGNLDSNNAERIIALILELCQQQQTSLILNTHDTEVAAQMQQVYRLQNQCLHSI